MRSDLNDFLIKLLKDNQDIKSIEVINGIDLFISFNRKYKRPETIRSYNEHLKPFVNFIETRNIKYTNEITTKILEQYIYILKSKGNKNITINKRINVIKYMLNYLVSIGLISEYQFNINKLEETQPEITAIHERDLINILEYISNKSDKIKLIVLLLISTGIRRTELVNIKASNINFECKQIYLDYTKNKKTRYIYFDEETQVIIKNVMSLNKNKVYLFENKQGIQMKANYITLTLHYIKHELDLKNLSPHKLRHTYGTMLLKNGANMEEVRRLLGHSDYKMTKRYLDYLDEDLKQANALYNPLQLMKKHN